MFGYCGHRLNIFTKTGTQKQAITIKGWSFNYFSKNELKLIKMLSITVCAKAKSSSLGTTQLAIISSPQVEQIDKNDREAVS